MQDLFTILVFLRFLFGMLEVLNVCFMRYCPIFRLKFVYKRYQWDSKGHFEKMFDLYSWWLDTYYIVILNAVQVLC